MRYHAGALGTLPDLTGAVHPAMASALAAVTSTPHFAHLVAQHAARMGLSNPINGSGAPSSTGGPGVAYGGGGAHVQERELRDIREFMLGFNQTAIGSGSNSNVVSRPQVIFRGERLVVPTSASSGGSSIAAGFTLVDIKVGNRSQLAAATSGVSLQAFIETAVGVRLALDTAAVAQDVTIIVNNIQAAAATFSAIIFGTIAQ